PDGRTLAIVCVDGKPRFWDVIRGCFDSGAFGKLGRVAAIAYSHDGKFLVAGDEGGQLTLWDVGSGERLSRMRVHDRAIRRVLLHPDDKNVVTVAIDGKLSVWDVKERVKLAELSLQSCLPVALSQDGHGLAIGGYGDTAGIRDAAKLTLRYLLNSKKSV